ncbi:hypothetical protein [Nocardioides sp. LML1-1-1.1]|uniref:hypothetical protein n=1 Tax=Nocardioides sp. LML1-1-1.1 TaxID=3135248 RepID=UPI00341BE5E3
MPHLRPTAIAGLLLAAVSSVTLSSCGFHYPTDRVNTIAAGVNNRDHSVDALGIRVLATAKGEGRLIGALSNSNDEDASLETVTSPDNAFTSAKFKPVKMAPGAAVNLAEIAPIELTGDFTAGNFITVELGFSTGETASLDVQVVKNCFQYTQVPTPTPSAEDDATAEEPEGEATDEASDQATEEETSAAGEEHADEHSEDGDAAFTCADQAPVPGGGEH